MRLDFVGIHLDPASAAGAGVPAQAHPAFRVVQFFQRLGAAMVAPWAGEGDVGVFVHVFRLFSANSLSGRKPLLAGALRAGFFIPAGWQARPSRKCLPITISSFLAQGRCGLPGLPGLLYSLTGRVLRAWLQCIQIAGPRSVKHWGQHHEPR